MNSAPSPDWGAAESEPVPADSGVVLPFPRGAPDGHRSDIRWTFTTSIRWINDTEGEWLRRELATVLRELLTWAREDMNADVAQFAMEERAA